MLLSVADICNIQTQISSGKGEIITFLVFKKNFFFTIISLRGRCYTSYFSIYKFSTGNKIGYLDYRGYLARSEDVFGCQDLGRRDCRWHLVDGSESRSVVSDSFRPHELYSPWNSPGQNTGVGGLSLRQGIFPTQGSNLGLLQCRRILYQLSHQGSPRIVVWVAYPFSGGSSWPRNRTGFSCIAGGFLTNWAFREAQDGRDVAKHARCTALSPQQIITWIQKSTVLWMRIFIHLFYLKNWIERPHNLLNSIPQVLICLLSFWNANPAHDRYQAGLPLRSAEWTPVSFTGHQGAELAGRLKGRLWKTLYKEAAL